MLYAVIYCVEFWPPGRPSRRKFQVCFGDGEAARTCEHYGMAGFIVEVWEL